MIHRSMRGLFIGATLSLTAAVALAQDITGAGATFPAPIYAKWADAYNKATGARMNYQSVGSGAGIRQIKAKTVDFGATDAPLTDEQFGRQYFPPDQAPVARISVTPIAFSAILLSCLQSQRHRIELMWLKSLTPNAVLVIFASGKCRLSSRGQRAIVETNH